MRTLNTAEPCALAAAPVVTTGHFSPVCLTGTKVFSLKTKFSKNLVRMKNQNQSSSWFPSSFRASFSADTVPAPKQRVRLTGQGVCGSRLLRDAVPLPQSVRGRGLAGPRAPAHRGHPVQVQQLPGKGRWPAHLEAGATGSEGHAPGGRRGRRCTRVRPRRSSGVPAAASEPSGRDRNVLHETFSSCVKYV